MVKWLRVLRRKLSSGGDGERTGFSMPCQESKERAGDGVRAG